MKRNTGVLLAVVGLTASVSPAGAARPAVPETHCVAHAVDQLPAGELLLSAEVCYPTFATAMAAEGVDAWGSNAAARVATIQAASFTIGTHYDGAGFSGSSTSVVGSNCNGGWLNVSATWNNRISSTINGCPRIRHFAGASLTGASESTYAPGGNLGGLNNQTSSIQYLT